MTTELPTGTVTLLFSDIEGSTALLDALGERFGDLLTAHRAVLAEVWHAHGGVVIDNEGDAFLVAFPTARAAAEAATDAQERLRATAWPGGAELKVRMGLHTGTPNVRDGRYWGRDVHYGARVGAAAHGGQVLLSATTAVLLGEDARPLGDHALKDFPEPQPLAQLGTAAFPPPRTLTPRRPALPKTANALLGRGDELHELEQFVREHRLVTIAGAGGTGKTRLAVELARRLEAGHAGGVVWVPLDTVSEAEAVPAAVAGALYLPEHRGVVAADRVAEHLAGRDLLLVLDNFEHVLDAAPFAARLAAAVPVLVTSQAPLRVSGEALYELGPLALPDGEDPEHLAHVPSVALLIERARAAAPGFALTPDNAAAVAELCARLEGMPLALELAAARLGLLEPAQLLQRLDSGLDALGTGARDAPARQRGLRAVLDWTTGLLEPEHRDALAELSVFAGGFTLELAEAAFGDRLEAIATLRDVGLVRRNRMGRLSLRPPVRRYAAELLAARDREHDARMRHATAVTELVEPWEARWMVHVLVSLPVVHAEAANVLEALAFARGHAAELHGRLAAATGWWMGYSGRHADGRKHVRIALDEVGEPLLRARLQEALAILSLASPDGAAEADRAVAGWRELDDQERLLTSLTMAANAWHHSERDPSRVLALTQEATERATRMGDPELVQIAHLGLAQALGDNGRGDEARSLLERITPRIRPGSYLAFWAATERADVELAAGRPADALPYYARAMEVLDPLPGHPLGLIMQADSVALALARLNRLEEAAVALAVAELAHDEISTPPFGGLAGQLAEARERIPPDLRAEGVERARELRLHPGLDWVRAAARAHMAVTS